MAYICTCKFVASGKDMDSMSCVIHHKMHYPCEHCDCHNYRPVKAPRDLYDGGKQWPKCICGHIAQEHN